MMNVKIIKVIPGRPKWYIGRVVPVHKDYGKELIRDGFAEETDLESRESEIMREHRKEIEQQEDREIDLLAEKVTEKLTSNK
jgi:hypothetical protein